MDQFKKPKLDIILDFIAYSLHLLIIWLSNSKKKKYIYIPPIVSHEFCQLYS